jgi:hypothetical protein
MRPTVSDVHIPTTDRGKREPVSKPWTLSNVPPAVAGFTEAEKSRFVEVANRVLEETGDEGAAIRAGLGAVNRMHEKVTKANHAKNLCMLCKEKPPELDVLWNGGHSRAWFCDGCFSKWSLDKGGEIVGVNRISEGIVPGRYKIKNSPKGVIKMDESKRLTINGVQTTLGEMAQAWLEKRAMEKPEEPEPRDQIEKAWEAEIIEKQDEKRIVYGVVLRPNVPDLQNDIYNDDEVEKAAHRFMIASRKADWMHGQTLSHNDAIPVESYIVPADVLTNGYQLKKGDWVVGMHVPNLDYWEKIKKGEARSFSIKGVGRRTPVG